MCLWLILKMIHNHTSTSANSIQDDTRANDHEQTLEDEIKELKRELQKQPA